MSEPVQPAARPMNQRRLPSPDTEQTYQKRNIEAYNASDQPNSELPDLLVEAAGCFSAAGFWAKATQVLRVLETQYPDVEHGLTVDEHKRLAVNAIVDRDLARSSPWGRRCLSKVDAQGFGTSSTEELSGAAECLRKAAYAAAALDLHRELDRRADLSEPQRQHNDEQITKYERLIERVRNSPEG